MTFCEKSGASQHEDDAALIEVLKAMLERDEKITARAAAKYHPSLKHASSITRSESRSRLLKEFQRKQKQYREWSARAPKRSRDQLIAQLAQKQAKVEDLERQLEMLRVSHIVMMRTVGELGGMSKLLKLYAAYQEVRSELQRIGLLEKATVTSFKSRT